MAASAMTAAHRRFEGRVCPGTVDSKSARGVAERLFPDFDAARKAFVDEEPIGRIAEPQEIAEAVAYLASTTAVFMRGTALVIDGGMALA